MCGVKLKDIFPSRELRERLGIDDITSVLQQNRLQWSGHVLQKDELCVCNFVRSMKQRVPDQEEDQRGPGERL